jgi:hypothetical protein
MSSIKSNQIKSNQIQCLKTPDEETIQRLQRFQNDINNNIEIAIRILSEIIKNVILDAFGLILVTLLFFLSFLLL